MDAAFADYAWSNDLRIAKLTGQRSTETYRSQVSVCNASRHRDTVLAVSKVQGAPLGSDHQRAV